MTWIKCSERMPEPRTPVLIYINDGTFKRVVIGEFEPNDYGKVAAGKWEDSCSCNSVGERGLWDREDVTHWMSLPEAPDAAARRYDKMLAELEERITATMQARGVTREQAEEIIHQENLRIARLIREKLYALEPKKVDG